MAISRYCLPTARLLKPVLVIADYLELQSRPVDKWDACLIGPFLISQKSEIKFEKIA